MHMQVSTLSQTELHLCGILLVDAIEDIQQPLLGSWHDAGHHAKVIEDQPPLRADSNVAWVGVRVQEAVLENLHKVSFCCASGNSCCVNAQ